jgi:tetratricopeptide (TPR) repeat protein
VSRTESELQARFNQALAAHRSGLFPEAIRLYREVLQVHPTHMGAAHMLGAVHLQQGQYEQAERQLRRAVQIDPYASDALNHLGLALRNLERLDEAVEAYDRAIALRPDFAEAFCNRGNALRLLQRVDAALASYDRAIALRPTYADAFYNRGALLEEVERWDDAVGSYENAIALQPNFPQAFNNLGNVLQAVCRFDEALSAYDRALALVPNYSEALTNRGNVLRDLYRYDEALDNHNQAIALKPDLAEAFNNRGTVYHDTRRFAEALSDYKHAVQLNPDHREAYASIGLVQLLIGDWAPGWENYERRFRKKSNAARRPNNHASDWIGEPLDGRSILLYGEQGLGDVIQFIRFVPILQSMGATVTVMVTRRLHRLLSVLGPEVTFVEAVSPDTKYDYQIALMSLPRAMQIRLDSVPASTPYLRADAKRAEIWRARLGDHGFKVGIAWQGSAAGKVDNGRSIPLREFAPLSQVEGARLISLQKNFGIEQLARRPSGMTVETPGYEFDDGVDAFIDTAAMMVNLDLVVTSDTSIAHLAGALGRPVWVALKYVPDWRWLLDREDSPWYPSMRLFRQTQVGDWAGVMGRIKSALRDTVRESGRDGSVQSVA